MKKIKPWGCARSVHAACTVTRVLRSVYNLNMDMDLNMDLNMDMDMDRAPWAHRRNKVNSSRLPA